MEAAAVTGAPPPPDLMLLGEPGKRWIAAQLQRGAEGLADVQSTVRLRSEPVNHTINLLELMGESREQVTADLVTELKRSLLALVPSLELEKLTVLLAETFAYLPVEELRPVPIAVLQALARRGEIPAVYLLRLATRPDLIALLPLPLQRLAWAKDANAEAWQSVVPAERPRDGGGGGGAFGVELDRLLQAYVGADAVRGAIRQLGPPPTASQQPSPARRAAQLELGKIADTIEASAELYRVAIDAIETGWREAVDSGGNGSGSGSPATWCALRAELPLLIADRKQQSLVKGDPAFALALCLDTASREGEIKKGPRETELKELLPWAVGGFGSVHCAVVATDAQRMVLGSPYSLPMLVRTTLNRLREAVESPTDAAAVAAALADPGTDPNTRFFSGLVSAALDQEEDEAAAPDLLSGLGALGLLLLQDSTGIVRRTKRSKMQKEKYEKARAVGASAPPATLPPLPPLGTEKSIAASLSAERLRGAQGWRRVLLFYILQRLDRREVSPTPPSDAMLLRGALLAAEGLKLPAEEEGRWCSALCARVNMMHRRGTLPAAVRGAVFNGYLCDAVARQLPPASHASYVKLLAVLLAPPTTEAAVDQGGAIKAQEALPLVGTALAAAEARGWFAHVKEESSEQAPAKRARVDGGAAGRCGAQDVAAAYEAMKKVLGGLGPAFAPVVGMVSTKLSAEEEERDSFFG